MSTTPEVDVDQLSEAVDSGATVVDVREPDEYHAGHVPNAVPMPMGQVPARAGELDRSSPVYVICASGNRSLVVTDFLTQHGFEAFSVAGGTKAWHASGRPIETGA